MGFQGFFAAITESVSQPTSNSNLLSQRYNIATELVSDTFADLSPNALIPGKIGQLALSLQSVASKDSHLHEKLIHGLQISINSLQIGLSMYLFLSGNESYNDMENILCRALFLSQLCYRRLMIPGWLSSEYKKPTEAVSTPQVTELPEHSKAL